MLDTPIVHLSVIVSIIYLVYRLKNGDYSICSQIDKPFVHLVIISFTIYLSYSYIKLILTTNPFKNVQLQK